MNNIRNGYGVIISSNPNFKECSPGKEHGIFFMEEIPSPFDAVIIANNIITQWKLPLLINDLWLHVFSATEKDNSVYVDDEKFHKTYGGFSMNF